jgi:hypothetical protein
MNPNDCQKPDFEFFVRSYRVNADFSPEHLPQGIPPYTAIGLSAEASPSTGRTAILYFHWPWSPVIPAPAISSADPNALILHYPI